MSTSTIQARLQAINATITGVESAPTEMPGSINKSDLPLALSYPEEADHRTRSVKTTGPVRHWVIRVYVRPIGTGVVVDEGFSEVYPLLDALRTEYAKVANQGATTYWDDLELERDDGVDVLTLHDAQPMQGSTLPRYWGTRVHLQITGFHDE